MDGATSRLERVLDVSSTLKSIMRLRFEARKVQSSGLDFDAILSGPDPSILAQKARSAGGTSTSGPYGVDLRDLTRAASSVAIMEGLLSSPALCGGPNGTAGGRIDVVEQMRPDVEAVSAAVRKVAAALLAEYTDPKAQGGGSADSPSGVSPSRLGATLQVYYHLGELPEAAWGAVGAALTQAERVTGRLFNPSAVQRLIEAATTEAREAVEKAGSASAGGDPTMDKRQRKKQNEAAFARALKRKLREKRAEAAKVWSAGISDAALRVWTLQRVLSRKSDPSSRQNFMDVVSASPIPEKFEKAERVLGDILGGNSNPAKIKNFVFTLFWNQLCISMGERIDKLLKYNGGSMAADTATLYPALRSAAIDMMGTLQDAFMVGTSSSGAGSAVGSMPTDDGIGGVGSGGPDGINSVGIMGGSAGLDFGWAGSAAGDMDDSGFGGSNGADVWTRVDEPKSMESNHSGIAGSSTTRPTSAALAGIFSSSEWAALQGSLSSGRSSSSPKVGGLRPLQKAFLEASTERLCAPLRFMFPEAVAVDEDGTAIDVLPHLPSRYDLAKIDAGIREELSLADPREGGGELTMVTMISDNVVDLVERFCASAKGAVSDAGEGGYLHEDDGTATEALLHDMKLCNVMGTFATSLRNAPENTFIAPYRPAHSPHHEEAANLCKIALKPALQEIDGLVKTTVLTPLYKALNKRVSSAIAMMHQGTYLEEKMEDGAFIQHHLAQVYDNIASNHLSKLPSEYSGMVASTIATYSIYSFVSNASLIRPLGENARLKVTQDLADLELCLEQLIVKGGSTASLVQTDGGRPYAELRAARNMLFWNGLENDSTAPADIAKAILREAWVKDVRPSTAFHFLLTFAPPLLSSPHHSKRISVEEYVNTLVKYDGSVDDGEASAWMTTLACCDNYHQRASVGGNVGGGGDSRVAAILESLGPELLRRRRQ